MYHYVWIFLCNASSLAPSGRVLEKDRLSPFIAINSSPRAWEAATIHTSTQIYNRI